jgi:hypothetical protein
MKIKNIMGLPGCCGIVLLAMGLPVLAAPKTNTPRRVPADEVKGQPYNFNGLVLAGDKRGSGFSAWNPKTFFSAAHLVYDGGWGPPPVWYPGVHAKTLDEGAAIQSRGYYRWSDYASLLSIGKENAAFGRDVILGFAFEPVVPGRAALINTRGWQDLGMSRTTMITGYPAVNAYTEEPIPGFFMHRTAPAVTPFQRLSGRSMITQLLTTGQGNSGGPIWTHGSGKRWSAAGVLVGGLPSEAIVYAFSNDIHALTRAVTPVISRRPLSAIGVRNVSASSMFFRNHRRQVIPDGVLRWSTVHVRVRAFERAATVKSAKLSLKIRTSHRGDLQVVLLGPGGFQAMVHNEQGANGRDLIINDLDLSDSFSGIIASGTWALRIQDRLKGDIATFESIRLEIAVDDPAP